MTDHANPEADSEPLDHALLSGQLTTEQLEALTPRTKWLRVPSHHEIQSNPHSIDLGTYIEPRNDGLRAIVTLDLGSDIGVGDWLHLSISRARRLPTWGDLVSTRDALGYEDVYFVQQLPPRRAWLNVHSYCLHLIHRVDQETIPRLLWEGQEGATGERYEHGKGNGKGKGGG